jgi:hydrogenase maturation protein HypF
MGSVQPREPGKIPPAGLEISEAMDVRVTGVVQGVGFRPFVHRLAARLGLAGWVRNEPGSVHIEVEGGAERLAEFVTGLRTLAPPLARLHEVETRRVSPRGQQDFRVVSSDTLAAGRLPISPDVAVCAECLAELFDPSNRRFRYPFITCTDCGPRFTVIESMPYDRERSTMGVFMQCPECLAEYRTPSDRRYHSETNSCPACGPRLWLEVRDMRPEGEQAIEAAAALLQAGQILAVRGLGGFHLAVDATNASAVTRLRERKRREAKPLAVMVRSLEQADRLGVVRPPEADLLGSPERPIVLLRRRPESALADAVSPGLSTVGVMVAYTPLHHLLLEAAGRPLVMTSGNQSDEPIATGNDEARGRLASVADAFLVHDREIVARYDDSLVRTVDGAPVFLRRARGYAPLPLGLPVPSPRPLLATGPHLKNTFTLVEGRSAFVSQHVGDLENLETLEHFQDALARFERLFRLRPEAVVRDLHPGYLSTRVAEESGLERLPPVQHHHAHIAAVQAEHDHPADVLGIAYDGTGYGADGKVWGAEFLRASLTDFRRLAHLRYAPLPGGDLAARQPWRSALGFGSLEPECEAVFGRAYDGVPEQARRLASQQIQKRINAPEVSSMGRLFDAAASLLGVRQVALYEGQAPMELESLAGDRVGAPLPLPYTRTDDGMRVLDPLPLLVALVAHRRLGDDPADLAARFHESVACGTAALAAELCLEEGLDTVALGGGVFQNGRLLSSVIRRLRGHGLRVLTPRLLSPNDGAISYGQAAVAAARLSSYP